MTAALCMRCGRRPKLPGKHRCYWCWAPTLHIEHQIELAHSRREEALDASGGVCRERVSKAEWPRGQRWCSGCQSMVPTGYAAGSKCRACASEAAHGMHLIETYGITRADYLSLLAFQHGACYICQQAPRKRRLAVDHDHSTGAVRGLLCADSDRGCNAMIGSLRDSVEAAQRLVDYLTDPPAARWLRQNAEKPGR